MIVEPFQEATTFGRKVKRNTTGRIKFILFLESSSDNNTNQTCSTNRPMVPLSMNEKGP
jgi:hypothetical protein